MIRSYATNDGGIDGKAGGSVNDLRSFTVKIGRFWPLAMPYATKWLHFSSTQVICYQDAVISVRSNRGAALSSRFNSRNQLSRHEVARIASDLRFGEALYGVVRVLSH